MRSTIIMASERRGKIGLSHWPFDSDFFDDIKIKKLVKSQGGVSTESAGTTLSGIPSYLS